MSKISDFCNDFPRFVKEDLPKIGKNLVNGTCGFNYAQMTDKRAGDIAINVIVTAVAVAAVASFIFGACFSIFLGLTAGVIAFAAQTAHDPIESMLRTGVHTLENLGKEKSFSTELGKHSKQVVQFLTQKTHDLHQYAFGRSNG